MADDPYPKRDGEARPFEPHPLRSVVLGEIHARPFRLVTPPRVFLHYAFEVVRGASKPDRNFFADLCRAQGAVGPGENARHHVVPFANGTLKWERHSEFTTYGWDAPLTGDNLPFAESVPMHPFGTSFAAPGPLMVAIRAELRRDDGNLEALAAGFDPTSLCVSQCLGGRALALTDFRQDGDGQSRILVIDRGLTPQEAGALVQRLLEIETYRTFSLLGLPEAERIGPDVRRIERELVDVTNSIRASEGLDSNRKLLADLSRLSADVEAGSAETSYRFGASNAYDEIVKSRLAAIKETAMPGFASWSSFLDRRMGPAIRTVQVTVARQRDLSEKLARAAELLRTRVDIEVEQQNRELLQSMNLRARRQLQLQQTVEGLSVAAISYYVVGLIGYLVKAAKETLHLDVDPNVATGFAVPLVVVAIYVVVHRIRTHHGEH
ncbi:MAG: DUF3422 domain-containing protein [Ancalomicrobiaceae bacterium]|nr:DUF3422 domain-containing protein [Ancalomicrobiaceae bacterium]